MKNYDIEGQLCFDLSTDKSQYVVQANTLVMARQSLKLNSAKVMRTIIMQIKKEDEDLKTYNIGIMELAELLGVNTSNLYARVDEVTNEILSSCVYMKAQNKEEFIKIPWVSVCGYESGLGLLIKINPVLKPYLLNLKKNYAQYQLEDILKMRSIYALRIYEMLIAETIMQYLPREGTKIEIPLTTIRHCCDCEDKLQDYKNFKRIVLEVASREIFEHTMYAVDYEGVKKTGRYVDTIVFTVKSAVYMTNEEILSFKQRHKI